MVRTVSLAGGGVLLAYAILSILTGQQGAVFGDLAQMIPPLAYAVLTRLLARHCRGQVRVFWNLNAIHALVWAAGQGVWTYYDVIGSGVPVMSLSDPIFFVSCIPLAAALYGRPEHDRPRWQFDIVLLDLVLIALFAAFVYIYFVVTIVVTAGPAQLYDDNLRQLLNARNLLLAVWAAWVWRTSTSPQWRKMLGVYAAGLALTFVAGIGSDVVDGSNQYAAGGLWDLLRMAPYVVMALAAGIAFDEKLFEPADEAPRHTGLPVVSMIAITLLVAIPAVDEVARRLFAVSPATELLRTRLALAMMIPCGAVVVAREFLSRRALVRASQDLVAAREQLVQKEKLAAVGQLVSGVAHELNNPLQGVLGYAELMLAARPAAPAAEELRAIRDNANRAASIVRNLLTFAGRTSSARGWQQMNRVVRDAVATREPQLRSQDIEIRVELAERLPLVYIDHARLEDVLVNLIQNSENAIAARQAGDRISSLVPANARGEITLTTSVRGDPDRILVEVFDNGSGLKGEDLNRVFDPFFTTREVGQGTGLGLSVCYGIVREHGGQITARNAAGGGAAFTIELPVMAESLATVAAAGAGAPPMASEVNAPSEERVNVPPRRPKALVVLSRRALVMIERTAYDAVIADVKMPELSGQELYGRVCQIRPEMARRFIFITGDIDGEETREFLDQSRCSYFMKPFNLERLTSAVDTLTGSRAPDNVG